jgi:hypothetical protein
MALKDGAGWNQTLEDWRAFLRLAPAGCFALEAAGRLIATSTAISYGPFGWVGMVLVDPAEQRRGFGRRMLGAAVEALERGGACAALDATPAGERLYREQGFAELFTLERWVSHGAATRPLERAGDAPACRPFAASERARIAAFDRAAFGADRAALLDEFQRREGSLGLLQEENDELGGYLMARRGTRFVHIGPLVARSERVAWTLAETALRRFPGATFAADVPRRHEALGARLAEAGFRVERTLVRMARAATTHADAGTAPPGGDPTRVYAIAGPEWG